MNRIRDKGPDPQELTDAVRRMIEQTDWPVWGPRLLSAICLCFLVGILVAGLAPFGAPRNGVAWPTGVNGLLFNRYSTVFSAGKFAEIQAPADVPCSVELWLMPANIERGGMIFTFYTPGSRRQFSVQQYRAGLGVKNAIGDRTWPFLYVPDLFRRTTAVFVTLTSDGVGTRVYIDGVPAQYEADFPISGTDFAGHLILGTSPIVGYDWSGSIRGLAFYDHELSPFEVSRHYDSWQTKGNPDASENDRPVAIYSFRKSSGPLVQDLVPLGVDLYTPDRYMVVDNTLLRPFWKEYRPDWGYYQDMLVNIVGFIPFGLAFCAYFSLNRSPTRAALMTIVFGFLISLTIETVQSVLPTRDSSSTDLINNVLGTACGVWLYRVIPWKGFLAKILRVAS